MSISAEDIKEMQSMVKEAVNLFAKERARANVACFHEPGVDWQLSLSDVPVTLESQPSVKYCGHNDAVFFMRMTEKLEDGRDKLDARVFMVPIMASKTGTREVPYILNTWPAMKPKWLCPSQMESSEAALKDEASLTSYITWCLDQSSLSQMPGLDEESDGDEAAGGGAEEMSNAASAAIYATQAEALELEDGDSD